MGFSQNIPAPPGLPATHPLLGWFSVFIVLYPLVLVIYRLYFSPIAHFPGSKLAAATGWYETWFDVFQGGQFTFQVERWHEQYGPIIRINPWEIHIYDHDFYDELYSNKAHYNKNEKLRFRLGLPLSTFDTIPYHHHQRRRAALNPNFSRQRILNFTGEIQAHADRLCDRLLNEYAGRKKVVNITEAWAAYTTDVILWYIVAMPMHSLELPDFVARYTSAIRKLARSLHVSAHFPWFLRLLQSLPEPIVELLNPPMKHVFQYQAAVKSEIPKIMTAEQEGKKTASHRTVFHELLQSNLSKEELSLEMLQQEAVSFVGGGVDTTKNALANATYHVLANPDVQARLCTELVEAIPSASKMPSLTELEKLPYLTAVIQEGLRLSWGIPQRSPRVNPTGPIIYKDYVIPAGVPVGMSPYLQLRHPAVFPNPDEFQPSRWLPSTTPTPNGLQGSTPHQQQTTSPATMEPAKAPNGKLLSKYQVVFSKGPRMCVGMTLASAEIVIGMATLFRRLTDESGRRTRMRLFETGRDTVDMHAEFLGPVPKDGTVGVRLEID
ncbi:MAG: hypothetical protein M1817_000738 [Caeruleum heppii]|nr:MAG: hypothetical protein M1817_000738 [Caeruleum heppii]